MAGTVKTRLMKIWFLILNYAAQNYAKSNEISRYGSKNADNLCDSQSTILVNTVDGYLHGINKIDGKIMWSKLFDKPMVKVAADPFSMKRTFIPQIGQEGNLFYFDSDFKLKKFQYSIKEIVDRNLGIKDDLHIFTGGKTTKVFAFNPLNGNI